GGVGDLPAVSFGIGEVGGPATPGTFLRFGNRSTTCVEDSHICRVHPFPALDVDRQRHSPPRTGTRLLATGERLSSKFLLRVQREYDAPQQERCPLIATAGHLLRPESTIEPTQRREVCCPQRDHRQPSWHTI